MHKEELDLLYQQGAADYWQDEVVARKDWQIARNRILEKISDNGNVLDLGCFDGKFLISLGEEVGKYGVEINYQASLAAKKAGIEIVGMDFEESREYNLDFDAITAFDVIEHTKSPFNFLESIVKIVRKNGIIVISTGNSAAFTSRLLGARYWYYNIAEHLSFINPTWCEWASHRLGIRILEVVTFSHGCASLLRRMNEAIKNIFYLAMPRGFSLLRAAGLGGSEYRAHKAMLSAPPSWMSAQDHFVCIFVKV